MTLREYLENISKRYSLGNATEHTFRGDLQQLLESMVAGIAATNEPKRIACGAPDYVVTRKEIPIGYIEAKDIGEDLKGSKIKEQRDRYKEALENLIFTDYLDFHLYRSGELKMIVRIAEVKGGKAVPIPANFAEFTSLITEFTSHRGRTIRSSKTLAEMMADKAKLLAYVIKNALTSDDESDANTALKSQMEAFRQILIHDLDAKDFSDVYAQTIAYGMFAARLHDPSLETFSRREAAELIPRTNPFLRRLFNSIATDIDERIEWIVDALADIFRAADIAAILKDFGKSTQTHDPIMHFYETFLAEYDPKLRKSRGVYYTPEPVVDFIVRAVDDILKSEFGLPLGLADTSKTKIKLKTQVRDERTKSGWREEEKEVHKVQILDPATGTGTFLAQVIKQVHKSFEGQQGVWNNYVDQHLIPRLNGFEILMASYAMAHLKLDLLLNETGYKSSPPYEGGVDAALGGRGGSLSSQRFRVYLTNALEEHHPETGTLWATWLSNEANEANHIKRDTPVMVVLGNPPYSGVSSNMGEWIVSLIENYKYIDGEHFGERKHWLQDDYVKFIRFGQHLVEKNGEGILAFINNHSFIDNPTFRGMRWNLLHAFDSIYVLDLQGSSKKAELIPENVASDENVFDIQQGVSINIFVRKRAEGSTPATVKYAAMWGSRSEKYQSLQRTNLSSIDWKDVQITAPIYLFAPRDYDIKAEYEKGFGVDELFELFTMGFASAQDKLTVAFEPETLWQTASNFRNLDEQQIRIKYSLMSDSRDWTVPTAKQDITQNFSKDFIKRTSYRPFDERFTYYTGNSRGFFASPQRRVMSHLGRQGNLAFCSCRMNRDFSHTYWIAENIVSKSVISSLDNNYVFPLYIYMEDDNSKQQDLAIQQTRTPNFNTDIVENIVKTTDMRFKPEGDDSRGGQTSNTFSPIDVLDYIYAVLHSPTYREKYKEFLKIDFPRVPYPKDAAVFWALAELGGELRGLHLLESPVVNNFITRFPIDGDGVVVKPEYKNGNVYFNARQYFENVPEVAWNFYIGGYQPARKWLKDRKGRQLSYEDIRHYQKIIVALTETERIMKEIDLIPLD